MTVVIDARLIYNVIDSQVGLENTGETLVVGPATKTNRFSDGVLYDSQMPDHRVAQNEMVHFVIPPTGGASTSRHSDRKFGTSNSPFPIRQYKAVSNVFTVNNHATNNAKSLLSAHDEQGEHVAVGYATVGTNLVDWAVLVEQAYGEVINPIHHLRDVLLGCILGTVGLIVLLVFPLAHYAVAPIRGLRAATKKTVEPYQPSSSGSIHSVASDSSSRAGDDSNEEERDNEDVAERARKEGFIGKLSNWRLTKRAKRAERQQEARRRTFRIPGRVPDRKHVISDELTDLTSTFNAMSDELCMQYERLEERVKERTKELELSKKAAEAANESKTLFIANISHELKTPLNGILGMCAVCMQEDDPLKIKRSLGIIYKSGDLLLNLLQDLLIFSKHQMNQQLSVEEKEFRLADVSTQVLSIFDKQAKEGKINLSVKFIGVNDGLNNDPAEALAFGPYGTGRVKNMCLWGDQHRILQVIINLVSNSLKFTPEGGSVDVRIKCMGEVDVEKALSASRKGSLQSKQSRQSRQSRQSKQSGQSHRGRLMGSRVHSGGSSSGLSADVNGDTKQLDTAITINALGTTKQLPQMAIRDRSLSPPPLNSKMLSFEFSVQDTGPGIPDSQQQRIFEPFVQGDLGLSKKYGGTGLGLSICAQLAGLMGGSISLTSTEGVGSVFTMNLPLRYLKERASSTTSSNPNVSQRNSIHNLNMDSGSPTPQPGHAEGETPPPTNEQSESKVPTPAKPRLVGLSQPYFASTSPEEDPNKRLEALEVSASSTGTKVRVLVAEDNKVNQEVVLRMLKLEDIYDVTVAKDGQEAYDMVKENMEQHRGFNLIFMDVQMPNLDGLQSTRLIREMGYSAPIVALTAFAEDSNVKECYASGMDYFLPKPIRRPALKQVLKKYCATIPEESLSERPEPEEAKPAKKKAKTVENGKSPMREPTRNDDEAVSPMS